MRPHRRLSPNLPILIGAAVMLSLSMGLRQCFGLIMPPLTQDLAVTISDFTLAMAAQNLEGSLFFGCVAARHSKLALLGTIYFSRSVVVGWYFMLPPTPASTLAFAALMGFL